MEILKLILSLIMLAICFVGQFISNNFHLIFGIIILFCMLPFIFLFFMSSKYRTTVFFSSLLWFFFSMAPMINLVLLYFSFIFIKDIIGILTWTPEKKTDWSNQEDFTDEQDKWLKEMTKQIPIEYVDKEDLKKFCDRHGVGFETFMYTMIADIKYTNRIKKLKEKGIIS